MRIMQFISQFRSFLSISLSTKPIFTHIKYSISQQQQFISSEMYNKTEMNDRSFKSQQILQFYNSKMHILIRLLLIILASTFTTLLFFDYDFSEVQLNLSSQTNCLNLANPNSEYLCNTCFKVSSKNKTNEQIIIESQTPFMLVSLKEEISGILSCQEWLQAVDYEEKLGEDPYYRQSIRLQPMVNRFLNVLQSEHNQILLIQRPQISNQHSPSNLKQYSSLKRPYQVLSYFTKTVGAKPFRLYLTNDLIKSQSIHMLTLLMLAGNIAVFYSFHKGQNSNPLKKYKENVLNVLGITGTLVWWFFAGLQQSYDLYISYCKVIFFSLSMGIIFGAAKLIFFGIFTIMYTLITLQQISALYRSFVQISLMFIVIVRLCSDIKNEYYHLQKNSNKKIFFLIMTLLVVGCSIASFIEDDSTLGQIFKFWQTFLMLVSFVIGVKNLDGDTYHKILNQRSFGKDSSHSFSDIGSSTYDMYEQEGLDETQLRQIKK